MGQDLEPIINRVRLLWLAGYSRQTVVQEFAEIYTPLVMLTYEQVEQQFRMAKPIEWETWK